MPARASCSPCATRAAARDAAASIPGDTEVRRLDLADLASVRAFADAWEGDIDVLINNAGVMAIPERAHRRRLRDADRHQPPRPLRAGQPAAAADPRPRRRGRLRRAPHGRDPARRPQLGAGRLQVAGAPTGSPSSPTCCSPPSCSAGSPTRARTSAPSAAHPGYAATNLQSNTGNVIQHVGMWIGNKLIAQSDEQGAVADALRGDPGHRRRLLRRPGRLPGGPRPPDARRPQRRGARRRRGAQAVGAVGGADGRQLPAAEAAAASWLPTTPHAEGGRRDVRVAPGASAGAAHGVRGGGGWGGGGGEARAGLVG